MTSDHVAAQFLEDPTNSHNAPTAERSDMAVTSSIGTTESCRMVRHSVMGASLPFGGQVNDSTYKFVTKSLRGTRHHLLTSKVKTLCGTHGLQAIRDFYPNKEILLACGCRRTCHNRKPEEIAAFEAAKHEHEARRQVAGKNHVNANGYCVTFVEDVEEIAA